VLAQEVARRGAVIMVTRNAGERRAHASRPDRDPAQCEMHPRMGRQHGVQYPRHAIFRQAGRAAHLPRLPRMGERPQYAQVDVLHDRRPAQRIEAGAVHARASREGQDPGVIPRVDVHQERPQLLVRDTTVAG